MTVLIAIVPNVQVALAAGRSKQCGDQGVLDRVSITDGGEWIFEALPEITTGQVQRLWHSQQGGDQAVLDRRGRGHFAIHIEQGDR